jgi:hypothetical protein
MGKTANSDELSLVNNFRRFFTSRARLKAPLISALDRIGERKMTAFVFGGALRDLMVQGSSAEPRDIDVVVDCSSIEELERLFSDYLIRRTRFGGLHLNVRGWAVDIWPLAQTWALREGLVTDRDFHALCKTTFLNVEAITAEILPKRRSITRLYSHGFFEAVCSRTLDINLEENPFPELCAVRSLVTASSLQFGLSKRLAKYVLHYLQHTALEELVLIQLSHYGFVRCNLENLRSWSDSIKAQIATSDRIESPIKRAAQLKLWCNCNTSCSAGCNSRCSDLFEEQIANDAVLPLDFNHTGHEGIQR